MRVSEIRVKQIRVNQGLGVLTCYSIITNISSVLEFQRWWVLEGKIFGQASRYLKEKIKKFHR